MSRQIQIRRGTATEHENFTGAIGEVTMDTTNNTLRVHDGQTLGGVALARADKIVERIENPAPRRIWISVPHNLATRYNVVCEHNLGLSADEIKAANAEVLFYNKTTGKIIRNVATNLLLNNINHTFPLSVVLETNSISAYTFDEIFASGSTYTISPTGEWKFIFKIVY